MEFDQWLLRQSQNLVDEVSSLTERITLIHKLSGFTVDELIDLFSKGWSMVPPGNSVTLEAELKRLTEDDLK